MSVCFVNVTGPELFVVDSNSRLLLLLLLRFFLATFFWRCVVENLLNVARDHHILNSAAFDISVR